MFFSYLHCYQVGNHDRTRISSSAGRLYVRAINMLLLTLPGTATTYYGEEIGMENINVTASQIQDPAGKYNTVSTVHTLKKPLNPHCHTSLWEVLKNNQFNVILLITINKHKYNNINVFTLKDIFAVLLYLIHSRLYTWANIPKWFLCFHCRVPVETLSVLHCSGMLTRTQVLMRKQISPGCHYTPIMKRSTWRYRSVFLMFNFEERSFSYVYLSMVHLSSSHSFIPRPRWKMMVLFWLSTASWTPCVNQSSPLTVDGSATSTLMPMSSLTSESLMDLSELSS